MKIISLNLNKYKSLLLSILFIICELILAYSIYIVRMPKYCSFEQLLHLPCLGCGLTRSFDGLFIYKNIRLFIKANLFAPFVLFGIVLLNCASLMDILSFGKETNFIDICNKYLFTKTTLKIALFCWAMNILIYIFS